MSIKTGLVGLGIAALLASPAGAAPYAGVVAQGESQTHHFDNHPRGAECIQIVTDYWVTLTYAPLSDTLTMKIGNTTVTGSNGRASLSFQAGVCTAFTITVTGAAVADAAAYVVDVKSGVLALPGRLGDWS